MSTNVCMVQAGCATCAALKTAATAHRDPREICRIPVFVPPESAFKAIRRFSKRAAAVLSKMKGSSLLNTCDVAATAGEDAATDDDEAADPAGEEGAGEAEEGAGEDGAKLLSAAGEDGADDEEAGEDGGGIIFTFRTNFEPSNQATDGGLATDFFNVFNFNGFNVFQAVYAVYTPCAPCTLHRRVYAVSHVFAKILSASSWSTRESCEPFCFFFLLSRYLFIRTALKKRFFPPPFATPSAWRPQGTRLSRQSPE